ncbi:MAG: DUF6713 family protein [Chloroflexota bacterium]
MHLIVYVLAVIAIEIHQVDAGAEREWDILHLPFGRPGFLVAQGVQVLLIATGLVLAAQDQRLGDALGALVGAGALVGFTLHVILWRRGDPHFRARESVASIGAMAAAGAVTLTVYAARLIAS